MLEAHLLHKTGQFGILLLRFPGESHDKARPEGRFRKDVADAVHDLAWIAGKGAPHAGEHIRMRVLYRNVEIGDEWLSRLAQILEQVSGHACGVEIEQAQPFKARQRQEAVQQSAQAVSFSEILAPDRQILSDEDQFLHTLIEQFSRFADEHVLRM